MQLQGLDGETSLDGEGGRDFRMCAVRLVDIRKIQALNTNITALGNPPAGVPGDSTMFVRDQEMFQARFKKSYGELEDYGKEKDLSRPTDADQQTPYSHLKLSFVRLVDCGKVQSRRTLAEGEPEDHEDKHSNSEFIAFSKSSRFDEDQQTLQAQLKMSSVRLVDCRKTQSGKGEPEDEADDPESMNNYFIPSCTISRFDGDQHRLEARLKVCLVKLVDCGKIQGMETEAEPNDKSRYSESSAQEDKVQTHQKRSLRKSQVRRHQRVCAGKKPYECK